MIDLGDIKSIKRRNIGIRNGNKFHTRKNINHSTKGIKDKIIFGKENKMKRKNFVHQENPHAVVGFARRKGIMQIIVPKRIVTQLNL